MQFYQSPRNRAARLGSRYANPNGPSVWMDDNGEDDSEPSTPSDVVSPLSRTLPESLAFPFPNATPGPHGTTQNSGPARPATRYAQGLPKSYLPTPNSPAPQVPPVVFSKSNAHASRTPQTPSPMPFTPASHAVSEPPPTLPTSVIPLAPPFTQVQDEPTPEELAFQEELERQGKAQQEGQEECVQQEEAEREGRTRQEQFVREEWARREEILREILREELREELAQQGLIRTSWLSPERRRDSSTGPGGWPQQTSPHELSPNLFTLTPFPTPHVPTFLSCPHEDCSCWGEYPDSLYPSWKGSPATNLIFEATQSVQKCEIHQFDVGVRSLVPAAKKHLVVDSEEESLAGFWKEIQDKPGHAYVRVLCAQTLSAPAVRMLGTKYHIEPSFFVPSRTAPAFQLLQGNDIAISLSFPRQSDACFDPDLDYFRFYMSHSSDICTVICIASCAHVPPNLARTWKGPYWQTKFQKSNDTILVLFMFCWYVIRAWDMELQAVYQRIEILESDVQHPGQVISELTQELHLMCARLLTYKSHLDDFNTVLEGISDFCLGDRLVQSEYRQLLGEHRRLQAGREVPIERINNMINLVFNSASNTSAEAAVKDSAVMKQISYLTMVFLPAAFVASVFGMNIKELNPQTTLAQYLETTIPFTALTIWILVALQAKPQYNATRGLQSSIWTRLFWPVLLANRLLPHPRQNRQSKEEDSRV